MKRFLSIYLLVILLMPSWSIGQVQKKITLSVKNKPLSEVLEALSEQADFHFNYVVGRIAQIKSVSINVVNVDGKSVLYWLENKYPVRFIMTDTNTFVVLANRPKTRIMGRIQVGTALRRIAQYHNKKLIIKGSAKYYSRLMDFEIPLQNPYASLEYMRNKTGIIYNIKDSMIIIGQ